LKIQRDKLIVLNFGEDISKMVKIQGNYIKFSQIKKRKKKEKRKRKMYDYYNNTYMPFIFLASL
jgi:hypothetical protein